MKMNVSSKRRAFTLIELLVVIAIIGLLIAILMPQLSRARRLAREAVCRHNLKQIHDGFQAVQSNIAGGLFPAAKQWPVIPRAAVDSSRVFLCPEAPEGNGMGQFAGLHYKNAGRPEIDHYLIDAPNPYIYRYGPTESAHGFAPGEWTYYILEDNIAGGPCNAYSDINDGLFRVNDPDNGAVKIELLHYTCGELNQLWLYDQQLFVEPSRNALRYASGQPFPEYWLDGGPTNYGINTLVNTYQIKPDTVVLLDLNELTADPTAGNETKLINQLNAPLSARHLGHMNVLLAGGGVVRMGPSQLYPQLHRACWLPQ